MTVNSVHFTHDVALETRFDPATLTVKYVAVVEVAARSHRDLRYAVARAREVLKDTPEVINDVELRIDDEAYENIVEARRKRARRAAKLGFHS